MFTAGVGENAAAIRSAVCRDAAWLGAELDEAANEAARGPGAAQIGTPSSRVAVLRLPTDEERIIARHTADVLAG